MEQKPHKGDSVIVAQLQVNECPGCDRPFGEHNSYNEPGHKEREDGACILFQSDIIPWYMPKQRQQ